MEKSMTLLDGQGGQSDGAGGAGGSAGNTGGTGGSGTGAAGGSGGGGQVSWRDSLPDDIKGNATLANVQSVQDLAKGYIHAQGLIGKKGIIPPGDKASDEEMQ